jgi:hypothetical protein
MPDFLKQYYDTLGPGGLPMKDRQAQTLDLRLKELPKEEAFAFRRCSLGRGLSELQPGERADVSWITEESPDRMGDVVLAAGMDDSLFQLNPIVTLNHCYTQPPVGRSLWRRKVREGSWHGVKAKTHYPPRPEKWAEPEWLPDKAYDLVKTDLLRGKSIGFFPTKVRTPTTQELERPGWERVRFIIEQWILAEYACCYLPVQPHAVVEQVSKSMTQRLVGLTPLAEIDKAVRRQAASLNLQEAIREAWDRAAGRV